MGPHARTVRLLLERGARPEGASDAAVVTPLQLALTTHHLGVAEALLKAGADANAVRKSGQTPLHQLVCRNAGEGAPASPFLEAPRPAS
ncbi:ankyrin repeat domain-containing protein [Corallococcus exercitus]|uniref:ankyrin repeat domain-containing protein n=1 Tax=Corallococcus exercitus TaxID=2316736 RepID=UPI000EA12DB9|nr:ankyrin repeat domain-containing protein [Corallococcus exercitus]RKG81669.1 ankyrin repeat domain-containing protein [Corallococcus exercitus]